MVIVASPPNLALQRTRPRHTVFVLGNVGVPWLGPLSFVVRRLGDQAIIPLLRRATRVAYLALAVPASALAVSSYFAYTTAGLDFEVPTAWGVDVHYYRLRWDDGSTWAGMAVQPVPRPRRPLDWFDPGGTLLAAPTRPEHRTRANSLGFWWVAGPAADPYTPVRYPGATESLWWALPSWLLLLVLWHRLLWRSSAGLVRRLTSRCSGPRTAAAPVVSSMLSRRCGSAELCR